MKLKIGISKACTLGNFQQLAGTLVRPDRTKHDDTVTIALARQGGEGGTDVWMRNYFDVQAGHQCRKLLRGTFGGRDYIGHIAKQVRKQLTMLQGSDGGHG